jgi:hypothetical protein
MKAEKFTSTQKQKQQCRLQTAEHIQVKSRDSTHPRGGKPKGEEVRKRCLRTCPLTLRRWAEEDRNQQRSGRSLESISREEGGPEETPIRVANQWSRGRKARIVRERR